MFLVRFVAPLFFIILAKNCFALTSFGVVSLLGDEVALNSIGGEIFSKSYVKVIEKKYEWGRA